MQRIRVEAPAKLNLHLGVGPGRPDGFHDIDGVFVALSFGDTLEFETVPAGGKTEITMNWRFPAEKTAVLDLPPEKNIIFRAVSLFRERTGYEKGLKITVEKRIPAGGGLGGGSSDAAAALLALNSLVSRDGRRPVTGETLAETGAALGSDVPFFLNVADSGNAGTVSTCAARVTGRGDRVQLLATPEEYRDFSFLLVNPGFPSDTPSAFREIDKFRGDSRQFVSESRSLLTAHCSLLPSPRDWPFFNDFLAVFEASGNASGAVYREILTRLKETGAEFAGLSGSGSTCFGVFSARDGAAEAKKRLLKQWPLIFETFLLAL